MTVVIKCHSGFSTMDSASTLPAAPPRALWEASVEKRMGELTLGTLGTSTHQFSSQKTHFIYGPLYLSNQTKKKTFTIQPTRLYLLYSLPTHRSTHIRKNDQINSKSTSDRQSKSTSERQSNLLFVCSILTSANYRVVSWFSRGLVVLAWSRESSRLAALRCRAEDAAVPRRSRNATLTSLVEIRL